MRDCPPEYSQKYLQSLQFTAKWEGGYVSHSADLGGRTNLGVIQAVYSDWLRRNNRKDQSVRFITPREACTIYHDLYWRRMECESYTPMLALAAFDTCVNFGVGGSTQFLQMLLPGLSVDGQLGRMTRASIAECDQDAIALALVGARIDYRYARVRELDSQKVFLQGWLNRDHDLKSVLVDMKSTSVG